METVATSKGQVVIPSKIRRQLGIKEGTYIQIDLDDQNKRIILPPLHANMSTACAENTKA